MKKIIFGIFLIILFIPTFVKASSGIINVTSTSNVVVGNKVTVTVTLSSNDLIGSWQMSLNYDRNYLKLTSSSAEAGGTMMAASSATGVKKKTYTFTFKTLKAGNTKVVVDSYMAYNFNDLSEISLSSSSRNIKIITQAELEASYSKDNNLKSLGVEGYTISPEFSKDVLEYSVIVPENIKEINIVAAANDKRASVEGIGVKQVSLGTNKFEILVRAENGSEKKYNLTVDVKDANPIYVTINDKKYSVVKVKESLPEINYYNDYTLKIDGFDIPAYKSDSTKLVLVGLKDESGEVSLFTYDEDTLEYEEYKEIGLNKITIYPIDTKEEIKGYIRTKININGKEYMVYKYKEDSCFSILYGMNVETGEKGFYVYDEQDQALIRYDADLKEKDETLTLYSYAIFGLIGFSGLLLIVLLIVVFKKKKKPKKKKEELVSVQENVKKDDKNLIEEVKDNKKSVKKN